MRILKALLVLLTFACALPAEGAKRSVYHSSLALQVETAYDRIMQDGCVGQFCHPVDEKKCGKEWHTTLTKVAHMPAIRATTIEDNFNDTPFLKKLRRMGCADKLYRFAANFPADTPLPPCPAPPRWLNDSGIWRLKITLLKEDYGERCNYLPYFQKLVDDLLWGGFSKNTRQNYILDLRDDPGGSHAMMLTLLQWLFSPGPHTHLYVRRERGQAGISDADSPQTQQTGLLGCPKVVLVNYGTRSAAEITTEFIRLSCPKPKTFIVGEKTYGKGAGTAWYDVGNYSVRVPSDVYLFGPDHHSINFVGIAPDVVVHNNGSKDLQLEKATEIFRCGIAETAPY